MRGPRARTPGGRLVCLLLFSYRIGKPGRPGSGFSGVSIDSRPGSGAARLPAGRGSAWSAASASLPGPRARQACDRPRLEPFTVCAPAGVSWGVSRGVRLPVTVRPVQSAVSASVGALQRRLGIQLVERDGRGLRLTDAGVIYADYVRRILGLLDEAGAAAAATADPERGLLRLAAVTTAGEQILPGLLASFRQFRPRTGIELEVGNRERVHAMLDRREVGLLISGRPASSKDIAVLGVRPHELIIIAPRAGDSRLGGHDLLTWADQQTWLLREKGSGTRDSTEKFLAMLEPEKPPKTLTVGSSAAIRQAVIAGLGATLISRDAVSRELRDGSLVEVPLPGTPLPRDWHLMAHPGTLPATALALVDHVLANGEFQRPYVKLDGMPSPRLGDATRPARPVPNLGVRPCAGDTTPRLVAQLQQPPRAPPRSPRQAATAHVT
jgi:LysR family transcriptional regulator, low CO2-responsive transcriptional regulator